jgi:hypothetical protein
MFITTRVKTYFLFSRKNETSYISQNFVFANHFSENRKNLLIFAETEIFRGFSRKIFKILSKIAAFFKLHAFAFTYFYNKNITKIFARIRTKMRFFVYFRKQLSRKLSF